MNSADSVTLFHLQTLTAILLGDVRLGLMRTQFIRTVTKRLDSFHAASYFSPFVAAELENIGLSRHAHYFASRGCALGWASAELVASTFFPFNPDLVAQVVPDCWDAASPKRVHEARLTGVRALASSLASSAASQESGARSSALEQAAVRVRRNLAPVIEAQSVSGRALYAAHRSALSEEYAQSGSDDPLFALWVTTTLLREFRGDGHVAALVSHGLSGIDASVLDCATGRAWRPSSARKSRGWSDVEWRVTAAELSARGLLTDESDLAELTDSGMQLREHIEAATDASVESAWAAVSDDALAELRDDAKLIAEAVAAAHLIPQKLFGRESS
jgi:hypothetical protein